MILYSTRYRRPNHLAFHERLSGELLFTVVGPPDPAPGVLDLWGPWVTRVQNTVIAKQKGRPLL